MPKPVFLGEDNVTVAGYSRNLPPAQSGVQSFREYVADAVARDADHDVQWMSSKSAFSSAQARTKLGGS